MADKTKGLLIEIGADTSKFSAAMRKLNQPIKDAERSLKALDKGLKIDPKNTALISQKFDAMAKAVNGANDKVNEIKAAMKELESDGKIDTEQYRRLQRELVLAEAEFRKLTMAQARFKMEQTAFGKSAAWASNMAPKLDALGNKFMKLTKAAGAFALALGGIAIGKAFQKLESLEETRSIFVGLGKDADEVTKIMDDVTNSVAGTKYALTDMAKVAKGALGGGADQKYGLANYLSRVGDLAAFTGGSVDQFGTIMNKALSKGTVDARLLNQMLAGGIPIYTDLQKSMGVSADELTRLLRAGKVGFDDLFKATEKYQGLATKTAMSTVGGAITILGQRWTNVGVAFLEGAYEPLRGGLIKLADYLAKNMNKVKEWGRAFGEAIKYLIKYAKTGEGNIAGLSDKAQKFAKVLQPIVGLIAGVVKAFMNLSATGKKVVAFLALATGPILKISAGMLKLYSGAFNVAKGFAVMSTAGVKYGEAMASASSGAEKAGITIKKFTTLGGGLVAPFMAAAAAIGIATVAIIKHNQKLTEASRAQKEAAQARADSVASVEAEYMATESLFNRLQMLNEVENKSTAQKEEMKAIVDKLNESVPDLALAYDEEKDSLNKSTDAIREHIKQAKKMALVEAYTNAAKGALEDYAKAQVDLKKKQEELRKEEDKLKTGNYSGAYEKQANKVKDLKAQVADAEKAMEGYNADAQHYFELAEKDAAATEKFTNNQKQLVNEIKNNAGTLPTVVQNSLRQTTAAFGNAGKNGATQYANGMKGASGTVSAAGKIIAGNAKAGIGSVSFNNEGKNAARGFINGIISLYKVSYSTGIALANKAKQGVKDTLKIKSPSRVMKDVGEYFGEGFAIGIADAIPQAVTAATNMANASVMAMKSTPVNGGNSLANDISGAVMSGMMMGGNNVPEQINVVVELGGTKVGEKIVNLYDTTATALYSV